MKCKDCGVTISSKFELEDKRCANCEADFVRKNARKSFQEVINALNYLDEDDYTQDNKLQSLYEELASYFTR
jgi:hypothetical protein